MTSDKTYTLYKDANCTELATAQEVYDAYVGDAIRIVDPNVLNAEYLPTVFLWQDGNLEQSDTANVQGVGVIVCVAAGGNMLVTVGSLTLGS